MVKTASYNTKIDEIKKKITDNDHEKCITIQEFNRLTPESFAVRLKQASLTSKNYIADFMKGTDFDNKLKKNNKNTTSNKAKNVLVQSEFKEQQDKINLTQVFLLVKVIFQCCITKFLNTTTNL